MSRATVSIKATDFMAMMGVTVVNVDMATGEATPHTISENPFTVTTEED